LVSTIGAYVHPRHSKGSEQEESKWLDANYPGEDLGPGRKFETRVFRAGEPCGLGGYNCGVPQIDGYEFDLAGYNYAAHATSGHMKMCEKWSKRKATAKGEGR
jgi:hypothetical protein